MTNSHNAMGEENAVPESGDRSRLKALIHERVSALSPTKLEVIDESHLHAGHAGAQGGASHFRLRIVGPCFAGLSPVARHRLVYDQLQDLIPFPIHALALDIKVNE